MEIKRFFTYAHTYTQMCEYPYVLICVYTYTCVYFLFIALYLALINVAHSNPGHVLLSLHSSFSINMLGIVTGSFKL